MRTFAGHSALYRMLEMKNKGGETPKTKGVETPVSINNKG